MKNIHIIYNVIIMATNCSCAPCTIASVLGNGDSVGSVVGIATALGVGFAGLAAILTQLFRIAMGKDVVSDCIIGRSKVHIEIDADGDGKINAANKLVLDLNKKSACTAPVTPPSDDLPTLLPAVPQPARRDEEAETAPPADQPQEHAAARLPRAARAPH